MSGSLTSSSIVIIEDSADMRSFLRKALQIDGHAVKTFSNGQAALEALQTEEKPSLILIDLAMPRMGGEEFITQYRQIYKDVKTKFLIVSSNHELKEIAQKMRADGHLEKPLDLKNLLSEVQRLIAP